MGGICIKFRSKSEQNIASYRPGTRYLFACFAVGTGTTAIRTGATAIAVATSA